MRQLNDLEISSDNVAGARLVEPSEDQRGVVEKFLSALFFGFVK